MSDRECKLNETGICIYAILNEREKHVVRF